MYFFISSKMSKIYHPQNIPWDFTTEILPPMFVQGRHEVGLVDISWNKAVDTLKIEYQELYVYCDLVNDTNFVNVTTAPILCTISSQGKILSPFYTPLARDYIHRIRIYFENEQGLPPSIQTDSVHCTLHIRPQS